MAQPIPDKLKNIDITRFGHRAAQLEKYKPVVSYWCNYWMLNQIIANRLQQADPECTAYAANLMDKLESTKDAHAAEAAISDDLAGQAYVEQFGLETFQRADNAIRANKVTKQTADTLQAAATFLDLLQIWTPLPKQNPEIPSKIKFAKFHALRIVKAVRNGEDPNTSNPPPEPVPEPRDGAPGIVAGEIKLDPDDPEVRRINGAVDRDMRQPSVEEVADVNTGAAKSEGHTHGDSGAGAAPPDVPFQPVDPAATSNPRASSLGGGYFPETAPGSTPHSAPSQVPSNPPVPHSASPPVVPPSAHVASPGGPPAPDPATFYAQSPPVTAPPQQPIPQPQPQAQPRPVPQPQPRSNVQQGGYNTDDAALAEAQRHARWAISALNFEDVTTAVAELRAALAGLGGL